ncbi:MAG: glutamine synthetase III [Planctomycetota bacterium]
MSITPRQEALRVITDRKQLPPPPAESGSFTELFGAKVFNDAVQRRRLPRGVYQKLRRTIDAGEALDPDVADAVADAMKDWAVEHGATHYTHWFQPMTGLTAEKHDSFLSPLVEGGALHAFSGEQLIQGEPDASSFPSGGIRATFEARGYTAWDPTSPAFLRETPFGSTLCVPTAFCSWTGEALDTKTPLLRSAEALDRAARRLLQRIDESAERVTPTVGPEQEYFLVDRHLYHLRPDLVSCGRTVIGRRPPKGQELEDHYFSASPQRMLNFQMDLERELWALGVPLQTRHGEVAPHQYESAPLFEQASVATDHNMLTMELMQEVANRHGFKCLMHEKPFDGVNGSGKHNNWSMADERGNNLFDPGQTPHENLRFVLFLTAIVRAVDLHQDLLRASIAHAGNDHRLGANEAPPAILSIFLGDELEAVVDALVEGGAPREAGGGEIQLGVSALPRLPAHSSDRNRTSPFAFTGNKWEFRAVGSSQSIALPNTVMNTIVAQSIDYLSGQIEARGGAKAAVQEVVRETLGAHRRILFSGDNYSKEWEQEAERRGLLNLPDTPSALARITDEKNLALFEEYNVLTRRELEARANILNQAYAHRLGVEALCMHDMASTQVLPAAIAYQERIARSIGHARAAVPGLDLVRQEELVSEVAGLIARLREGLAALERAHGDAEGAGDEAASAASYRDGVRPSMSAVRAACDELEGLVDDDLWPLPKYSELLMVH